MEAISALFGEERYRPVKDRKTERGELMDRMLAKLNPPRSRTATGRSRTSGSGSS